MEVVLRHMYCTLSHREQQFWPSPLLQLSSILCDTLLGPSEQDDGISVEDNLALLQKVHPFFLKNAPLMPAGSFSRRVESTSHLTRR